MAMTVPTKEHFERLSDNDFAVVSFGAGKCMYTGWGGMGFTRDTNLSKSVRQIRNQSLSSCNTILVLKRGLRMLSLNLMYKRFTYGSLKKIKDARQAIKQRLHPKAGGSASYLNSEKPLSKEWFLPTTYVDRHLMLYNLRHAREYAKRRVTLAQHYHNNFKGVAGIIRPDIASYAMSHYTIRVKHAVRPLIRNYLCKAGIDVGTLYDFPNSLSNSEFPNASKIASEVLNLPLSINLSLADIDRITESVVRSCSKYK
jgi:dTDP-4-amino-4,6-dideoxygalactose transaminase